MQKDGSLSPSATATLSAPETEARKLKVDDVTRICSGDSDDSVEKTPTTRLRLNG